MLLRRGATVSIFGPLWSVFKDFAEGKDGLKYLRALPQGYPFSDWSIHDRYSRDGFCCKDALDRHRKAAWQIRQMVESMKTG